MNTQTRVNNDVIHTEFKIGDLMADAEFRREVVSQLGATLELSLSIGEQGLTMVVMDNRTSQIMAKATVMDILATSLEGGLFDGNSSPMRTPAEGASAVESELMELVATARRYSASVDKNLEPERAFEDLAPLYRDPAVEERIGTDMALAG